MVYKHEIRAAKNCFHKLYDGLSQEEVDFVLNLFDSEEATAEAFGVHRTTVTKWVSGANKPNGANKMGFRFLLNYLEQ